MKNLDDRLNAVLEHINKNNNEDYTLEDIEVDDRYQDDKYIEYKTPEGIFLCMTEEESYKAMEERERDLIDDIGIDKSFSEGYKDYVFDNFVEWNDGEECMREYYSGYYEDIESESASDGRLEDRLQEELFKKAGYSSVDLDDYEEYKDRKDELESADDEELVELLQDLLSDEQLENITLHQIKNIADYRDQIIEEYLEDEFGSTDAEEIEEWLEDYDTDKYDLIDEAVEDIISEYNSPIEWAIEVGGREYITELERSCALSIDYEGIAKWVVENDGFGSLSRYDGDYDECGDYYIYKDDNDCIDRVSEVFLLDVDAFLYVVCDEDKRLRNALDTIGDGINPITIQGDAKFDLPECPKIVVTAEIGEAIKDKFGDEEPYVNDNGVDVINFIYENYPSFDVTKAMTNAQFLYNNLKEQIEDAIEEQKLFMKSIKKENQQSNGKSNVER